MNSEVQIVATFWTLTPEGIDVATKGSPEFQVCDVYKANTNKYF